MLKFISCGGVASLDLDRRPWLDRPWSDELRDERLGPRPCSSPLTDQEWAVLLSFFAARGKFRKSQTALVVSRWLLRGLMLGGGGRCTVFRRVPNASPRPVLLVGLIRARARCSPRGTSFGRSVQPRPPNSGGDGGPTYVRAGVFLPSRKCLGAPSPWTPLYGYTFTLFRRHPCRHGRSSIRLQAIHMYHSERLVPFPAHDNSSSIQYFGAEPRELQLRSPRSFQRYVVNPYQFSSLIFPPLDFTDVVMFLMQRCSLQPRTGVPVRCSQSSLECGHVLAHRAFFLLRPQGCPIHDLDRKSCLPTQHHHVGGHSRASLWRRPVAHQDKGHELVPLLLRLSARRLQAPAQCPKAPFYEPVALRVVRCSPSLVYPKQATHLQHYLKFKIRALVTMQLSCAASSRRCCPSGP